MPGLCRTGGRGRLPRRLWPSIIASGGNVDGSNHGDCRANHRSSFGRFDYNRGGFHHRAHICCGRERHWAGHDIGLSGSGHRYQYDGGFGFGATGVGQHGGGDHCWFGGEGRYAQLRRGGGLQRL